MNRADYVVSCPYCRRQYRMKLDRDEVTLKKTRATCGRCGNGFELAPRITVPGAVALAPPLQTNARRPPPPPAGRGTATRIPAYNPIAPGGPGYAPDTAAAAEDIESLTRAVAAAADQIASSTSIPRLPFTPVAPMPTTPSPPKPSFSPPQPSTARTMIGMPAMNLDPPVEPVVKELVADYDDEDAPAVVKAPPLAVEAPIVVAAAVVEAAPATPVATTPAAEPVVEAAVAVAPVVEAAPAVAVAPVVEAAPEVVVAVTPPPPVVVEPPRPRTWLELADPGIAGLCEEPSAAAVALAQLL